MTFSDVCRVIVVTSMKFRRIRYVALFVGIFDNAIRSTVPNAKRRGTDGIFTLMSYRSDSSLYASGVSSLNASKLIRIGNSIPFLLNFSSSRPKNSFKVMFGASNCLVSIGCSSS